MIQPREDFNDLKRLKRKKITQHFQCNAIEIFVAKMRLEFDCRALIFFPEFPQHRVFLPLLRLCLLTHATDNAGNEGLLDDLGWSSML